ncbi:MAG: cytochrome P460 family protein [Bosea sp.]|uniref:cytochrome P460 family protein n=1 Tax=Bosea sp. (in: a-proteobacteria) TaxID=1871050 RepID=UPI001AC96D05|nr:cytochrome P460 family protein [Bosea sp. (in: a-proteobacteria)]MBN9467307.1 cytochrome P460 family protein [Bosea sp. (in: a-proteobacteria)]
MKFATQAALAAAAMSVVLAAGWQVHAEATRATLPDLDKLVHYTTVRRGNVTEHIMTTPQALEAVKNKQPIPNGTHFVLVDFRDGKLFRYFVMEKGEGWGADYDERRRTGDWQYQWFWPDGKMNTAENTARCASCHSSQASSDYLYTAYRIPRFNGKPVE